MLLLCLTQTAPLTCPPGSRLEREVSPLRTASRCVNDEGLEGQVLVTGPDGSVLEAGQYLRHQKHGRWLVLGSDGGLQQLDFVDGFEGPIRPCPSGAREASTCVARCCDVRARWCVAADGGLVGPWDEWSISGHRLRSNLDDPSRLAPFRDLGAVRRQSLELLGDAPR